MRLLIPLVAAASLAGCIGAGDEVFSERTIVGKYRLKAWEDGAFYLRTPSDTGDTLPDEPIQRIGWDSAHVLVLRRERGPVPSWRAIDIASGTSRLLQSGPAADTSLARIRTMPPDSAWTQLGSR